MELKIAHMRPDDSYSIKEDNLYFNIQPMLKFTLFVALPTDDDEHTLGSKGRSKYHVS